MDKARHEDPDIADEYDFSNAVPNRHAERMKDGFTVRMVSDEEDRQRRASPITRSTDVEGGTPVFAGTQVPVDVLFDYLESGKGFDEFLKQHPTVSRDHAISVLQQARHEFFARLA